MHAQGYAHDQPAAAAPEIMAEAAAVRLPLNDPGSIGHTGSRSAAAELRPSAQERNPAITIGSRIRTLRRARGLTQDTLALSTGVSRSAVAQWETGRAGQMGGKLRRIAEALGVSVSMLKEGWEGMATDSVLSAEEMSLLKLFRRCGVEDRTVLMHVAQKLSANPALEPDSGL